MHAKHAERKQERFLYSVKNSAKISDGARNKMFVPYHRFFSCISRSYFLNFLIFRRGAT